MELVLNYLEMCECTKILKKLWNKDLLGNLKGKLKTIPNWKLVHFCQVHCYKTPNLFHTTLFPFIYNCNDFNCNIYNVCDCLIPICNYFCLVRYKSYIGILISVHNYDIRTDKNHVIKEWSILLNWLSYVNCIEGSPL